MKLTLKTSVDIFIEKFNLREPRRLVHWGTVLVFLAVILWVGYALYTNVFLAIVSPTPINQSQISAKQEKVNRQLLDTVQQFDTARKQQTAPVPTANPFTP